MPMTSDRCASNQEQGKTRFAKPVRSAFTVWYCKCCFEHRLVKECYAFALQCTIPACQSNSSYEQSYLVYTYFP